jgi:hypothetical protein
MDDVRRVREHLDQSSAGDIRRHVVSTNAAFEKLRVKLGIVPVDAPPTTNERRAANA